MPITDIWPKFNEEASVSWDDPQTDLIYMAKGSQDRGDVELAIAATLPLAYRGLYLQHYNPRHLGGGVWEIGAHYGRELPLRPSLFTLNAKTTGGTIHRQTSLQRTTYTNDLDAVPPSLVGILGQDAANMSIGVTRSGIEGVDVVSPHFGFTVTKKFQANLLPSNYLNSVYYLAGCTNDSPYMIVWKGQYLLFQEGELLFMGASVTDPGRDPDGNELIDVAFEFEAQPNATGLPVAGFLIDKKGWEYVWIYYRDEVDVDVLLKKPIAAFVERVYYTGNFFLLGI